ncbi:MAG: aminotransferase class I/II-fold pyridoxal phosphate-dependent enzyme [Alphaproteobacteria bacterium]|nr:MAG: aminotransferase class I/II-fold pyridoxal phosphate-dependent enzyme [Alphaproteobacteria bacterium]TAF77264.1 MAG: aminotransferase class I/II-fold pyridoxal phosphate-dependent enzyme [Alphaproteobacteria bacterium]
MHIAQRGSIRPFEVMEAFREAAQLEAAGKHIVHLSLGQPATQLPDDALSSIYAAMRRAPMGYTDARGMPELRERIAQHYHDHYRLTIPAHRIFVTVGSSAAFMMALLASFDVGQRVGIALPCYPAYPNMMQSMGLISCGLRADASLGFQPDVALLRATPPLDGLVIASPSNPTGSVLSPEALRDLCAYTRTHNIQMISDEIYHHVTYDGTAYDTILRYDDEAIVVNSFSKYYLLSGWRLGWAVIPERLVRSYESIVQSFFISPPAISQYAALAIWEHDDLLRSTVARYAHNRSRLKETLEQIGFRELNAAHGAFYLYGECSALSDDSRALCQRLLHEAGVCAVAGTDFDQEQGHRYVRFSFCGDMKDIEEACIRLKAWHTSFVHGVL